MPFPVGLRMVLRILETIWEWFYPNDITQKVMERNNYKVVIRKPGIWTIKENIIGSISIDSDDVDLNINKCIVQRSYDFQYAIKAGCKERRLHNVKIYDGTVLSLSSPKTSFYEMIDIIKTKSTYFSFLPIEIITRIYEYAENKVDNVYIEKFNFVSGVYCENIDKLVLVDINAIETIDSAPKYINY